MKRAVLILTLFLAGCGGGGGATTSSQPSVQFAGGTLDPPVRAPNFALRDQRGRIVSLAEQRGHWAVVTFLYTHCPDVCPLIAANLNQAIQTGAGRRAGLHVLAVSVDPARDTPAAVRKYARDHRLVPSFSYLIGTRAQLQRVWSAYHVAVQPGPRGTVSHSSFEMLVDPKGMMRLIYDATVKSSDVSGDLAKLEAG
jgi:protein SCO1/2